MQVENLINSQRVPRKLNGLTGHAVWIGGMNRTVALGRTATVNRIIEGDEAMERIQNDLMEIRIISDS